MTKRKIAIVKLSIIALMSALYFVLDRFSIPLATNIRISFAGLPTLIAAIYLGPLSGMTVGLIGSFLGQLLEYGPSATTVLWILPPAIRGLSMGLILLMFKKRFKIIPLSLGIISSSLLVTISNTLVMYIDSKILGYYSFAYVFGATTIRLISSVATAVAMIILIVPVTYALNKQNILPKIFKAD